jgi:thiamine kinase-like enzyme
MRKQADEYYETVSKKARDDAEEIKNQGEIYYQNLVNSAELYKSEQQKKHDLEYASNVKELSVIEEKLQEILPIYKTLREDMIMWKPTVEKLIKGYVVHINDNEQYRRAVFYFTDEYKKIEEVTK